MYAPTGFRTLLAVAGFTAALAGPAAWAGEHSHGHEQGAASPQLTLNQGRKWPTDAPLRQGMESIRGTMDAVLHDVHEGKLSARQYGELAAKVNAAVGGIVADCKLEPQADAQLHVVLGDVLAGVEAMEGKSKKTKRQAGAVKVVGALEKYGAYFDHPGWAPLAH